MNARFKRVLFGSPFETSQLKHQRLSNPMALAVFSSDALSSVAYATEEILIVLLAAGTAVLHLSLPVALAIGALFTVVTLSYRQTIMAYPNGGGAYIVAQDNLGRTAGLVAAGALLTDYILTVAVSMASGVAAITSAIPALHDQRVVLCVAFVTFITVMNLRGVRESGALFSIPTYFFLCGMGVLLAAGLYGVVTGSGAHAMPPAPVIPEHAAQGLTVFLVLRAFSSGCAALTGIEAISNGIPAFKTPEAANARKTLTAMAVLCIGMFLGITVLARQLQVIPAETETVVSQIARAVFGHGALYYCLQAGTAMILIMAANTSFADFPRLASLLAKAGYLPRQMAALGDRLVFVNGIVLLGALSSLLLVVFGGSVTRLIPLYAVGVFVSFTLSQSGMVVHWLRSREPGWRRSIWFNAAGAATTAVVAVVIASTKFMHGAWVVIILIPILAMAFGKVYRHYEAVAEELRVQKPEANYVPIQNLVFLPLSGLTDISIFAMRYCLAISPDVTGLYVDIDPAYTERFHKQCERLSPPIPITVLASPYRSVTQPLIDYIQEQSRSHPDATITLVLPEFMPRKKWQLLLHNQMSVRIYAALRRYDNVVIISVRKNLHC